MLAAVLAVAGLAGHTVCRHTPVVSRGRFSRPAPARSSRVHLCTDECSPPRVSLEADLVTTIQNAVTAGVVVTRAADVSTAVRDAAADWPVWDSEAHPQVPSGSGNFSFRYTTEERVLVLAGAATLTPDDGSPPVELRAGDAATFQRGFACAWHVTERLTKRYANFDARGERIGVPRAVQSDPVVERADVLLAAYDASHRAAASAAGADGIGGALTANKWAADADKPPLTEAVHALRAAAASRDGRIMLGICADDAAAGVAALKAWVGALGLPRGVLHGMDRDGVPLDMSSFGGVYVKYNSQSNGACSQPRPGAARGMHAR